MEILVTGGSRGIGKELNEHYIRQNNTVTTIDSNVCDLSDWQTTSAYFSKQGTANWDLVIHCAGVNLIKAFYKMEYSAFRKMVDTNLVGTFNLLKHVIPKLKCGGSIVLFSSAAAFLPTIGQSAYACCKSALHGLVRVLARELLVEDKYIFLIAPGLVETGMPYHVMSETALQAAVAALPMRRLCTIGEIVNAIDFACRTPYLTGQTIHLNGAYNII